MGTSIVRGIEAISEQADCVVVALVDHPAVPPHVVTNLIMKWREGVRLVIPTWDGRGGHPILIDCGFRSELLRLDPNRGLKSLFDAHPNEVLRLPVDSPYVAQDIDTWDDYRVLHQTIFGHPPPELS
jgi:molybdenum cofactor cytidylyltransferase